MSDTLETLKASLADRYAVERLLGKGGMATVFLARDVKHDRAVAIKVLHPELSASIGADRFEREIKLAAKLQHPNILGLYDSGETEGLLYYVMPFIEGESLRDRLERDGQLPIEDAVQFVLEVSDALGYAHARNIVHRDIKPENILISNGHALVADFGIARAASEGVGQKLTQTGMAIGTPVYMAPEQAAGEAVGPSADIYSMGCLLYELLAGEPPFTGKNALAIMSRHAMETVPSIRIIRSAVPEEVEEAIFAAMAKTPADRPQTAAKFSEILGVPLGATATRRTSMRHTATRRIPTQPTQVYSIEAAPPPMWRRPLTIGIGVLALAGVALAAWRLTSKPPAAKSVDPLFKRVAVAYFSDNSTDHRLRPVADGLTEGLIRALAQVSALTVVSQNGVAPYRGTETPPDSILRALNAGTIVVGSVEPEGKDRVRITTRLRDANGPVSDNVSFVVMESELFAAEDSVAQEVARSLRAWLGSEIALREQQSATRNPAAWGLVRRAESIRKDAEQAEVSEPARATTLLIGADSILQQAEAADGRWIEPIIVRGEVAYQLARREREVSAQGKWVDQGLGLAARALAVDGGNARALALRGTLRAESWRLRQTTDPVAREQLLKSAKTDLVQATQIDPSLASAFAILSMIDLSETPADVYTALIHARSAYQADAYLRNSDVILNQMFWASYNTEAFSEAGKWCGEGRRRFPKDPQFAACQLWLLLTADQKPDIPMAWKLAADVASLAPVATRGFWSHQAQQIVGGVIGRAALTLSGGAATALRDSAERVLVRARADRTVDPELELPGYEAIMRVQIGDLKGAIALLQKYVALNPDHSFEVGGNIHWWWRKLADQPAFQALKSTRK